MRSSSPATIKNKGRTRRMQYVPLLHSCLIDKTVADFMRTEPQSRFPTRGGFPQFHLMSYVRLKPKVTLALRAAFTKQQDIDEDQILSTLKSPDELQPSVRLQECEANEGRLVTSNLAPLVTRHLMKRKSG
ncbi:hypothetical protein PILCRDRAFT_140157 [Piloderma croceum F 1598]|uniref:Uncharacterized protein n=1 Tax=Piloderma croceum (strain F 1598) TaxID=765440 RepID=A0A0C3BVU3_PILCF|nr:hypothetical protein PILCRDRAFT_140157 [Piloderma croceum F 1598]